MFKHLRKYEIILPVFLFLLAILSPAPAHASPAACSDNNSWGCGGTVPTYYLSGYPGNLTSSCTMYGTADHGGETCDACDSNTSWIDSQWGVALYFSKMCAHLPTIAEYNAWANSVDIYSTASVVGPWNVVLTNGGFDDAGSTSAGTASHSYNDCDCAADRQTGNYCGGLSSPNNANAATSYGTADPGAQVNLSVTNKCAGNGSGPWAGGSANVGISYIQGTRCYTSAATDWYVDNSGMPAIYRGRSYTPTSQGVCTDDCRITSFTASDGQLAWSTNSSCTSIGIDQGIGTVGTSGTHSCTLGTTYTLTADETLTRTITCPIPELKCAPLSQTVNTGQNISLTASLGSGSGYSWQYPNGTQIGTGSTLNTYSFSSAGTKRVYLYDSLADSAYCDVTVNALVSPTAVFTINGSSAANVNPGGTLSYHWSSANGTSATQKLEITGGSDLCSPPNVNGTADQNLFGDIPPTSTLYCQRNKIYTFTYTVTGTGGTASAVATVTVNDCTYSLPSTSAAPTSATGSSSFNVNANGSACQWTAVSNSPSWLTVTGGSPGVGTGTVNYSYTANTGTTVRVGTITIGELTFTVTQAAPSKPSISLSSPLTFSGVSGGAAPDTQFMNIANTGTANLHWSGSTDKTWCHLANTVSWYDSGGRTSGVAPNASENLYISLDTLYSEGTYYCTVTISDSNADNSPRTLMVTYYVSLAPKPSISLSPASLSFSGVSGGLTPAAQTFTIRNVGTAPLNWSAARGGSGGTWCSVSPTFGTLAANVTSSNITVSVTAPSNVSPPGNPFSDCSIVVSDSSADNSPQTLGLTYAVSAACTYTLSPTSASPTAAAGTGSFSVIAGSSCAWTASSNSAWLTITSGSSGTSNGTVSYSYTANTGTTARTGTITAGGQTFTVTQATGACGSSGQACCSSSPTCNDGYACSGSTCVTDSCASYSACSSCSSSSNCGWCSDDDSCMAGNSSGPTGKTCSSWFWTSSSCPVTCTYSLSSASASVGNGSGTGSFTVTPSSSSCAWTASSNGAWLTVTSGSSGTGNGTVNYSYTANSGSARAATITAGGQSYTLSQGGGVSGIDLIVTDFHLENASGNTTTSFNIGDKVYPSVTIKNIGSVTTPSYFYISLSKSIPGGPSFQVNSNINNFTQNDPDNPDYGKTFGGLWVTVSGHIAPGQSMTYSRTQNAGGTWYTGFDANDQSMDGPYWTEDRCKVDTAWALVNSFNNVAESNLNNNTSSVDYDVCGKPDLTITDFHLLDMSGSSTATFYAGDKIYPSVTIQNIGRSTSSPGYLSASSPYGAYMFTSFYSKGVTSQPSVPAPSDVKVFMDLLYGGYIGPGQSVIYSPFIPSALQAWTYHQSDPTIGPQYTYWTATTTVGTYTAGAFVDSFGYLSEYNKNNNFASTNYTILTAPTGTPDMQVSPTTMYFNAPPESSPPPQTLTITNPDPGSRLKWNAYNNSHDNSFLPSQGIVPYGTPSTVAVTPRPTGTTPVRSGDADYDSFVIDNGSSPPSKTPSKTIHIVYNVGPFRQSGICSTSGSTANFGWMPVGYNYYEAGYGWVTNWTHYFNIYLYDLTTHPGFASSDAAKTAAQTTQVNTSLVTTWSQPYSVYYNGGNDPNNTPDIAQSIATTPGHNYLWMVAWSGQDSSWINGNWNSLSCAGGPPDPPIIPPITNWNNFGTDHSVACGNVRLYWTDNSTTEDGFKVYKGNSGSSFPGSGLIKTITTTTQAGKGQVYTYDVPLGDDVTGYQYWVTAYNAGGESSPIAFNGGSTIAGYKCQVAVNTSDQDLVGAITPKFLNYACDGKTESLLPSYNSFKTGDIMTFAINICNDIGSASATNISIVESLINLKQPTGEPNWNACYTDTGLVSAATIGTNCPIPNRLTYDAAKSGAGCTLANIDTNLSPGHFCAGGSFPNQILVFNLKNSKYDVGPTKEKTITFDAQLAVPDNFSGASSRFQTSAQIIINGKDVTTSSLVTPLQLFTNKNIAPSIQEKP